MDSLIHSLWLATALLLVMEGIMPFLSPQSFRQTLARMMSMTDKQLRTMGLVSMVLGLLLLYWVNN